tara:strand:- start:105 stop:704 length:600 start_codon:yes stop_codon:yes gene_type:complete
MKILFFTDVHHDKAVLKEIVDKSKDCDLMVCCGDLSIFGGGLKESINILKRAKKKILIIHGNHELPKEMRRFCDRKNTIFMHKKILEIENVLFFAYGGGGFSFNDGGLDKWVAETKSKIKSLGKNKKRVFFSHPPPYGTELDKLPQIGHRGCMSVRNAIKILKPDIASSGHFHETFFEKDKVKKSLIINPGDCGTILEI